MSSPTLADFAGRWKDIASSFLRLGATSFGGPAVMGIMQTELQQKRRGISKDSRWFAIAILVVTIIALVVGGIGTFKVIAGGAILGVLRSPLSAIPGVW